MQVVSVLVLVVFFVAAVADNNRKSNNSDENQNGAAEDIEPLIQRSLDEVLARMEEFRAKQQQQHQQQGKNSKTHQRQQHQHPAVRPRPFVTLTYAQSIDGKIALLPDDDEVESTKTSSSNWVISGPESMLLTHGLRSIHDAILVGGKTLFIDNPRLRNRLWPPLVDNNDNDNDNIVRKRHQPVPVILDTYLKHTRGILGSGERLIRARNPVVCCSDDAYQQAIREGYKDRGESESNGESNRKDDGEEPPSPGGKNSNGVPPWITLVPCKTKPAGGRTGGNTVLDLSSVLSNLYRRFGIRSIMVEGGACVISEFLKGGTTSESSDDGATNEKAECSSSSNHHRVPLVDCLCVTVSNMLLGARGLSSVGSSLGGDGRNPPLGPLRCIALGQDIVLFSDVVRQ